MVRSYYHIGQYEELDGLLATLSLDNKLILASIAYDEFNYEYVVSIYNNILKNISLEELSTFDLRLLLDSYYKLKQYSKAWDIYNLLYNSGDQIGYRVFEYLKNSHFKLDEDLSEDARNEKILLSINLDIDRLNNDTLSDEEIIIYRDVIVYQLTHSLLRDKFTLINNIKNIKNFNDKIFSNVNELYKYIPYKYLNKNEKLDYLHYLSGNYSEFQSLKKEIINDTSLSKEDIKNVVKSHIINIIKNDDYVELLSLFELNNSYVDNLLLTQYDKLMIEYIKHFLISTNNNINEEISIFNIVHNCASAKSRDELNKLIIEVAESINPLSANMYCKYILIKKYIQSGDNAEAIKLINEINDIDDKFIDMFIPLLKDVEIDKLNLRHQLLLLDFYIKEGNFNNRRIIIDTFNNILLNNEIDTLNLKDFDSIKQIYSYIQNNGDLIINNADQLNDEQKCLLGHNYYILGEYKLSIKYYKLCNEFVIKDCIDFARVLYNTQDYKLALEKYQLAYYPIQELDTISYDDKQNLYKIYEKLSDNLTFPQLYFFSKLYDSTNYPQIVNILSSRLVNYRSNDYLFDMISYHKAYTKFINRYKNRSNEELTNLTKILLIKCYYETEDYTRGRNIYNSLELDSLSHKDKLKLMRINYTVGYYDEVINLYNGFYVYTLDDIELVKDAYSKIGKEEQKLILDDIYNDINFKEYIRKNNQLLKRSEKVSILDNLLSGDYTDDYLIKYIDCCLENININIVDEFLTLDHLQNNNSRLIKIFLDRFIEKNNNIVDSNQFFDDTILKIYQYCMSDIFIYSERKKIFDEDKYKEIYRDAAFRTINRIKEDSINSTIDRNSRLLEFFSSNPNIGKVISIVDILDDIGYEYLNEELKKRYLNELNSKYCAIENLDKYNKIIDNVVEEFIILHRNINYIDPRRNSNIIEIDRTIDKYISILNVIKDYSGLVNLYKKINFEELSSLRKWNYLESFYNVNKDKLNSDKQCRLEFCRIAESIFNEIFKWNKKNNLRGLKNAYPDRYRLYNLYVKYTDTSCINISTRYITKRCKSWFSSSSGSNTNNNVGNNGRIPVSSGAYKKYIPKCFGGR